MQCVQIFSQVDMSKSLFAKINDSIYIYKFEVSNRLYTTFLNSFEFNKDKRFKIDTTQWLNKEHHNVTHAEYYHKHLSFKDYPVVNISYESAQQFCLWLTSEYNKKNKQKKVIFRLPTEDEWKQAAKAGKAGAKFGWISNETINERNEKYGNYNCEKDTSLFINNENILNKIRSYVPNEFGIFNMSGNVSEMILDKNFVKGGDWFHCYENCMIDSFLLWDGIPKPYIGFRFVMVFKEN